MSASLREQIGALVQRGKAERERLGPFELPVILDLDTALYLVANVRLALRHPENTGTSAEVARRFVDGVVARLHEAGYHAHAEMAEADAPQQAAPQAELFDKAPYPD